MDPAELAPVLARSQAFFDRVGPPGLVEKPAGPCTKEVLGVVVQDEVVGVVDLLKGYPTPDTGFIGLLVLDPAVRGQGLGRQVEAQIVRRLGTAKVRLAVNFVNPRAKEFWASCGYRVIGERPLRLAQDPTPTCWLMQKRVRWF